ncbi:MAG: YerC/YecD family TrpR-related protein [Lachnospiraceae bacterium]|nr:YerC/YecD family TrpR-related protein [Ruminococcus sp.]MCM1275699.1 YerC/YecD family TrpR-related protein [Lachnospiraceae bacterium]
MRNSDEDLKMLYKAVLTLKDEKECAAFFEDLCTPQELGAIAQRLHVASMLTDGMVYNTIVEATGASTATISRVNKTLTYQTAGGYKMVFERIKGKK